MRTFEAAVRRAAQPTREILARVAEDTSCRVRAMVEEIARRFLEPGFSVKSLCNSMSGIDRRLKDRFTEEVGLSPGNLIRQCRMETALRLLRDKPWSVDDIAVQVGFDTRRAFEKRCRKWCGRSPADLRDFLRQRKEQIAKLPEEVFSWYTWHERVPPAPILRAVIAYLEEIYGPVPA